MSSRGFVGFVALAGNGCKMGRKGVLELSMAQLFL
jgi:hypothetical protein